ncbi:VWA domain-containing protein [Rhizobium sp. G21]|uniref:vWA domain-containing protein n=1 Tax=Rhizobium sp. G21 TaxID=2758439 RepID=UPI0016044D31|nr:VWA domain-containing protein [Rhizobium sp. G21]MBB1250213.1 VWA domain-containing protein [Rhizobium sp. G21]
MSCCGTPLTQDESDHVDRVIAERLAAFLATLRDNAFAIGLREAQDAALLMAKGFAAAPTQFRSALKHLLTSRREEWQRFDGLFDAFWLGKRVKRRSLVSTSNGPQANPALKSLADRAASASQFGGADQVPATGEAETEDGASGRMEGASSVETLDRTDFRKLSDPDDIARAHAIAARLARVMRTRLTRRDEMRAKGRRIDLRRTIHANISHGGAALDLVWRRRKVKPLRLVVLLDASASMQAYTGVFLRFIHGVLDEFREAEAFLFDTRLAHVSSAMRERNPARALDRLGLMARGAGGGTRIAESLATFNRWHAARVIHSRTCVMIVSDGYETGDAAALGREMSQLARRCRRIVWLNPMLGWDGYEPRAAGIRAALPYVQLHAPANTLASLADLEPYLARL